MRIWLIWLKSNYQARHSVAAIQTVATKCSGYKFLTGNHQDTRSMSLLADEGLAGEEDLPPVGVCLTGGVVGLEGGLPYKPALQFRQSCHEIHSRRYIGQHMNADKTCMWITDRQDEKRFVHDNAKQSILH